MGKRERTRPGDEAGDDDDTGPPPDDCGDPPAPVSSDIPYLGVDDIKIWRIPAPDQPNSTLSLTTVQVRELAQAANRADLTRAELRDLQVQARREQLQDSKVARRERRAEARAMRILRDRYASRLYSLLLGWLICVGLMIAMAAVSGLGFDVPVNVQVALVAGSTLNVIGLFAGVVRFLFSPPKTFTSAENDDKDRE